MRHKGERHIPDFAHKPKPARGAEAAPVSRKVDAAPVKRREPVAKPQATSSKAGRRGQ